MKTLLYISLFMMALAGGGYYVYEKMVIKGVHTDLYDCDYMLELGDTTFFHGLHVDALALLKAYDTDLMKDIVLLNGSDVLTFSGWITVKDKAVTGAYLRDEALGAIYFKREDGRTGIVVQNFDFFRKAMEAYSRSHYILKDDLNYGKLSRNTFMTLPPKLYTAAKEIDITGGIRISTTLSVEEIMQIPNMEELLEGDWWPRTGTASMPF